MKHLSKASIVVSVVLVASFALGCGKKRRASVDDSVATTDDKTTQTLVEKFPTSPAVVGSKSYPLPLITTENLLGRTKEGGAPNTWPFVLVDARTRVEFEAEHIPGAVNCPAEKIDVQLSNVVPDKTREVVFYCNGPDCTKSHKAGRSAIAAGFGKAAVYDDGLPAWKKAGHPVTGDPLPKVDVVAIEPAALNAALKSKSITVIDIRPRDEFLTFRIAGALNVELDELDTKLKEHVQPTTVLCVADYTGKQQEMAARLLSKLGYKTVKSLQGGMRGWQQANLPVDKGLEAAKAAGQVATTAGAKVEKPVAKAPTPAKP